MDCSFLCLSSKLTAANFSVKLSRNPPYHVLTKFSTDTLCESHLARFTFQTWAFIFFRACTPFSFLHVFAFFFFLCMCLFTTFSLTPDFFLLDLEQRQRSTVSDFFFACLGTLKNAFRSCCKLGIHWKVRLNGVSELGGLEPVHIGIVTRWSQWTWRIRAKRSQWTWRIGAKRSQWTWQMGPNGVCELQA